ncbi:MAG: PaaI family thioesterase [Gemmatimonadaceae bacterium]
MTQSRRLAPRDAKFESRVRDSFDKQAIMRTFGASLEEVAPGRVCIRMPFREDLAQQHGFLHAGAIAAVADSACGYAALTLMPADAAVLSIEFKVNMLAPAKGESIVARADVIRSGRTIVVCRADVYALNAGEEKLVAAMQGTMMTVTGRDLTD